MSANTSKNGDPASTPKNGDHAHPSTLPVINTPPLNIPEPVHSPFQHDTSPFRHPVCFHDGAPCFPASPKSIHMLKLPHDFEVHGRQHSRDHTPEAPVLEGRVKTFCRQKGHGFIQPDDTKEDPVFFHISDIHESFAPTPGDHVTYQRMLIPPKCEKFQAVNVHVTALNPRARHESWVGEEVEDVPS